MTIPPTLNYQTPPPKDDRPFNPGAMLWGLISGLFTSGAGMGSLLLALAFVNAPILISFAIAVTATLLFNIWVGRDIEKVAETRGYFLGIVLSLPLMLLSCASCLFSKPPVLI